ncbi:hypothetical protein BS47DRAFT_1363628 [Hydnum rufescens UP504]|uniref:Uncharacterized protein n=1 Tax=Hydnum rufescens UP504 TaxID=1448309 RepID=A0A9P6AUN9_9AGAM|nr:hypothetical protein BS47DRAFT_1363628 [Hydnum rufescens UP504]
MLHNFEASGLLQGLQTIASQFSGASGRGDMPWDTSGFPAEATSCPVPHRLEKHSHQNPTVSMRMPNGPQSVICHAYYERGFNGSRTKPFSSRGPLAYPLMQERLAAHPVHLDEASLAHFMRSFLQSEKLDYKGAEDNIKLFQFRCLHDEYLVIFGDVLRRVFDPAVEQNVFRCIALPTELEDTTMRPAYITSVVGSSFCEHRVEYIVRSGSSVMKGNCTLDIVLYALNVEESKQSFDGEEDEELCRSRIDLEMYPSVLEQAEASPFGNFYVDFVLGFEMDTVGEIIIACLS